MFDLLASDWLELTRSMLGLSGFLLASLDFVLLLFACFTYLVWLLDLIWFALFAYFA